LISSEKNVVVSNNQNYGNMKRKTEPMTYEKVFGWKERQKVKSSFGGRKKQRYLNRCFFIYLTKLTFCLYKLFLTLDFRVVHVFLR